VTGTEGIFDRSQMEKKDWGHCRERSACLHCKHVQGLFWSPWQMLDREERHHWNLCGDEYLKDMGAGAFIGLMDDAEYCNAAKHHGQGGERHCYWKKSARLLHH